MHQSYPTLPAPAQGDRPFLQAMRCQWLRTVIDEYVLNSTKEIDGHPMHGTDGNEQVVKKLLALAGEDPEREGLLETPARFLKAWRFWTSGYGVSPASVLKSFADGAENYDEMVTVASIPFYSHCEHHLAPFFGYAHVAYIPNGRIVGLSKIPRLVDIFARRLSVQEKITNQIADALMENLRPRGVGVVMQARHLCMESRGICKSGSVTTTSALRAMFKDAPEVRAEFLSFVQAAMQGIKIL